MHGQKKERKIYNNVNETIGNTPIIKLNRIIEGIEATVLVKVESFNPTSSVKDRIALAMVETAEKEGCINSKTHIIESTSGNTGIGLAMVCASKGYKLTLTMPDSMSIERQKILKAFGANLVLTPAAQGMQSAIEKAQELAKTQPSYQLLYEYARMAVQGGAITPLATLAGKAKVSRWPFTYLTRLLLKRRFKY